MTHPKKISIADYSYPLPDEFIAHYPLTERDASRLLVYRQGNISEDIYRHIGDHLPENALLVFNNTKVVEARILFRKPTGAQIEIFCLEPPAEYGGIAAAMVRQGKVRWKCLIGGASKWKPGQVLVRTIEWEEVREPGLQDATKAAGAGVKEVTGQDAAGTDGHDAVKATAQDTAKTTGQHTISMQVRYVDKLEDSFLIEFSWEPAHLTFAELLHQVGQIPLPPYIKRAAEASDQERYQTVYARHDGSVAAPTAGLHFTESIFQSLAAKNIQQAFVTLHVGAGTFLPVKTATMEQHVMHVEYISVTQATLRELLGSLGGNIIAVGTTSARTIESLYWLGVKTFRNPDLSSEDLVVRQWDAYADSEPGDGGAGGPEKRADRDISPEQALTALLEWLEKQGLPQLLTQTQLLITPGYDWKIARGLITNFHQPESTLLLLVASLIGKDWRKVYDYALEHQFRFLSYGDGSLLLR